MSIACSTLCLTVLKSGLRMESYLFINFLYFSGTFAMASGLVDFGSMDWIAATWKASQEDEDDQPFETDDDGIDTFDTRPTEGNIPFGTLMNSNGVLVLARVSYIK